jgi:hypothetical protein
VIVIGCYGGSDEGPAMALPAALSGLGGPERLRGGSGCAGRSGVMGIFERKAWGDDRAPGPRGIHRGLHGCAAGGAVLLVRDRSRGRGGSLRMPQRAKQEVSGDTRKERAAASSPAALSGLGGRERLREGSCCAVCARPLARTRRLAPKVLMPGAFVQLGGSGPPEGVNTYVTALKGR